MQSNWAPTTRGLAILTGLAAMLFGARRPTAAGTLITGAGAASLARGITNVELTRLMGIDAGRRAVDLQKTINIAAPIDRVFSVWSKCEDFPLFMSRIRDVRDLGNGRSHWVMKGPAGTTLEWDAVVTEMEPNKIIAWKTENDAIVEHAGIIHFDTQDGHTRVQVRLSYNPPGGLAGHSIARLLGMDPKTAFDEDLVRMKSYIETGIRPHDASRRYAG
jgi:uncharacterized membrane protein